MATAVRILFLIGQFVLELIKLLPKSKPTEPKAPSTIPEVDEPGKALERARERARHPADPRTKPN